jgi:hypothetical protein
MATITVSHYIYLSREQRYELNDGKDIEIVGICVPVWFQKGNTSEPAQEIFCKYKISNKKTGANVKQIDEGFDISMPSLEFEDEKTNEETKKIVQKKLGTSENLLDLKDGGQEICEFRIYQKLQVKNELHHLVHFIEIKPIEILMDSVN